MEKITKDIAKNLLGFLGGGENITHFGVCMTRIRVTVKDASLVDEHQIKGTYGVLGVIVQNEYIQIVFGPGNAARMNELFQKILRREATLSIDEDDNTLEMRAKTKKEEIKSKHTGSVQIFLSKFATIFTPLIPGFIAAGLLLGFATFLEQFIHTETASSFTLGLIAYMKVFSKGLFSFMSILIGYNASRAFGGSGVIGAVLASFFVLGYNPEASSGIFSGMSTFFGMQIDPRGNVVGVLITAILSAWVEKKIRKVVPDNLEVILTSTATLLIMGAATFVVIMPIGVILFKGMSWLFVHISGNPIGGAVLAGLFLVAVMFGIHQGFVPIYFALMESQGFNSLFPILAMAGAGQVGAALALYFVANKNSRIRKQIVGAIIPGFLGIGEPLIYGVTLPRIKPFITACAGGAVGGLFLSSISFFGFPIGLNTVFGPSGLLALPLMTSHNGILPAMLVYFLGLVVSYIAGFVITYFFGKSNIDLE